MKYCSNCGSKWPEDVEFYTECGQKVNSAPQTPTQAQGKIQEKVGSGQDYFNDYWGNLCSRNCCFYGDSELLFPTGSFCSGQSLRVNAKG